MYGISKTKLINPAHIVSIDYSVDDLTEVDGTRTGMVIIQMSNQSGQIAYSIKEKCEDCEKIINDLIDIIRGINREEDDDVDFTIIPGGSIN